MWIAVSPCVPCGFKKSLPQRSQGGHRGTQGKSISCAFPRLLLGSSIWRHFHIFRLAHMARSTHSVHYVVEEKLAVSRDHHDLQFVGEALGDDLIDQERILFQD